MSSIRMEHIAHSYGSHEVLHDFSMDIHEGEFISVIGGSGSGKTTVLKLINGLLKPNRGEIFIQDQNIKDMDQVELRRSIGYVIQSIGLFPHMTIEDNIGYVLSLTRQKPDVIKARVERMMEIMKLDESLLKRYPDELSGGQKQRVGIARALASEPRILLMDEPFGAVDEITRHALQDEIKRIHEELSITIFFITHDIKEALRLGSRVMIMKDGGIEQFDTPVNVKKHPDTAFVKQLLSYLDEGI